MQTLASARARTESPWWARPSPARTHPPPVHTIAPKYGKYARTDNGRKSCTVVCVGECGYRSVQPCEAPPLRARQILLQTGPPLSVSWTCENPQSRRTSAVVFKPTQTTVQLFRPLSVRAYLPYFWAQYLTSAVVMPKEAMRLTSYKAM